MRLVLLALLVAVGIGYLFRGRLSNLMNMRLIWSALAPTGLGLQVLPTPEGHDWLAMALLFVSFGLLLVFVVANVRLPGFAAILLGLLLNLTVIAVNLGMPVGREALVASDQQDTLTLLVNEGGAKHHLAGPEDDLLFLADVIALPAPIRQAISVGDIAAYGGVMWLVAAGMRPGRRRHGQVAAPRATPLGAAAPLQPVGAAHGIPTARAIERR